MNIQRVSCFNPIVELEDYHGDMHLLPNETYTFSITYPLGTPLNCSIKTGKEGMGMARLFREIGKAYKKVYANDAKYGIWGHCIGDLMLEGIEVNHNKKIITLYVGS